MTDKDSSTVIDFELQQQLASCVQLKRNIKTLSQANRLAFQRVMLSWAAVRNTAGNADDNDVYLSSSSLPFYACGNPLLTWPFLQQLLALLPTSKFDWSALTCHPNMSFELIMANRHLPWKMDKLAANPNVTAATVKAHPEINWSLLSACNNPQVSWSLVRAVRENMKRKPVPTLLAGDLLNRAVAKLSANEQILPSIILANFDFFNLTDNNSFLANPNLTSSDILTLTGITTETEVAEATTDITINTGDTVVRQLKWSAQSISCNPNITEDIIRAYPNFPWDWSCLIRNQQLSWPVLRNNVVGTELATYDYVWEILSQHSSVTWQVVKDNPDLPWAKDYLMTNPNISWQLIEETPDYEWYSSYLIDNVNTTIADIVDMQTNNIPCRSHDEFLRGREVVTHNFSWVDVYEHDQIKWPIADMAGWSLDGVQLGQLRVQHALAVKKLAKLWCWKLFGRLLAPPHGLHFLLGLRQCLAADRLAEFDAAMQRRDFKSLDRLVSTA